MTAVHLVVPVAIDDPRQPSGGNTYDRKVAVALARLGWTVHEHAVVGGWPHPDQAADLELECEIGRIGDGALVLVDGLIASAAPEILVPEARRLRLVVLLHLPLGLESSGPEASAARSGEEAVLSAAAALVTTSRWTRRLLIDGYGLPAGRIHVAEPGTDPADLGVGTASGAQLLCVAAVTPVKGHDILVAALAQLTDLTWQCTCVGSLDRDGEFVSHVCRLMRAAGIDDRMTLVGPRTGADLGSCYAGADVVVVASRTETYGMVVTEALARGVPLIATETGGVPEALGRCADGSLPGLLVPVDDPPALADALRRWLVDADLREGLRSAARRRRSSLIPWSATGMRISEALAEAST